MSMTPFPTRLVKVTRSGTAVRVSLVASDDRVDLYRTRMTSRLFQNFIDGRKECEPYLSVSHYLHPVGEIEKLYIDGRYLKLTGIVRGQDFISRAVADCLLDTDMRPKIAASIGFDHDDYYIDEPGGGLLTYVGGRLIHVALTTIPGNPRARLVNVEMQKRDILREDAERLVGPLCAAYLAEEDSRLRGTGKYRYNHGAE